MDRKEKHITGENAADRMTYAGEIFTIGERKAKHDILNTLPKEWKTLHENGAIHIHDLDAYGNTYNCLAFEIQNAFPYNKVVSMSDNAKIITVFDFMKDFIMKLGNEQSGGMAFANFDNDLAELFEGLEIDKNTIDIDIFKTTMKNFILWCNDSHERLGKVSYYVSLNIGLANSDLARLIADTLLDTFYETEADVFKPNIIFKLNKKVNLKPETHNHALYVKALRTTAKKMIPTYVFTDTKPNSTIEPGDLVIMGCRTRVVDNKYGNNSSIGRGNITNISINLPRIALELKESENLNISTFLETFRKRATVVANILEDRYQQLITKREPRDFRLNLAHNLWVRSFQEHSLDEIFIHGTLSIGYIGLSEAVEIMTGNKPYQNDEAYKDAFSIVEGMRAFVNQLKERTRFNYSLLATSGELISGRFNERDKAKGFNHKTMEKGFYTNSFHVEVDSGLSSFDKIEHEAPFHALNNGGCITYLELKEAPINNIEALHELIEHAYRNNIHYLGFNFDLDICKHCGNRGIFDACDECGSQEITRIRRVSGYLEIVDYFTSGKQQEAKTRTINKVKSCTYQ